MASYIFPILILLIYTITDAYSIICDLTEVQCYSRLVSWCCEEDEICGTKRYQCDRILDTKSDMQISAVIVIVILSFIIIICYFFCFQTKQTHQRCLQTSTNVQRLISYPTQIGYTRPVNTPSIHNLYEAPPPSYEAATANYSSKYP